MNPKVNFVFISLFLCITAAAQTAKLSLIVQNEKKEKIENATVELYQFPDNTLVTTKLATPNTVFILAYNTTYTLKISAVGMQTVQKAITPKSSSIHLIIELKKQVGNLKNITVVSRKPLVKQEDDKTIVDAEVIANSSTNAFEVLEKTPGTVVDQDGNVYLNSSTPAVVYINGREIKLSPADLTSLLKSLPASSVTKIEILRNPSAKYDAESSGGIVNIVLKKGVKLSTSGSMNVGYFQGKYHTALGGFNFSKGGKKINSYLSYQFTEKTNFEEISSTRFFTADTSLSQISYIKYPTINNYVGAGLDIDVNKKLNVGYDLRFTTNNNKSSAVNDIDILEPVFQSVIGKDQSVISNRGTSYYVGNNFSAKYKIDSTGSEWTTELDYNYYSNPNTQLYTNYMIFPSNSTLKGDGQIRNKKNIFTFQTDLVLKLKNRFILESGFKLNTSNSHNSALYYNEANGSMRKLDSFQTNTFRYKESIAAAYTQLSKTFWGFTLKPGIRMETTNITGNELFPKDTTFKIKRTDFFPYVYLRHKLFKMFGFTLTGNAIYRKSITRPYYEVLNPYPKYIDQYIFEVGNPDLQPQFTTNYEFNVVANDYPVFSIGVNDIKNIFTNVTYQDNSSMIAYRTYDNLGSNKEFYLRIVGGVPPGKKYFFYAGAQHNFSNYDGFYQGKPLHYKRGTWTFFMYHNYKASPNFNITVNGFMRLRGLINFYEIKTLGSLNVSFNQSLLKKKCNIILSVNDLLKTNIYDFTLQHADVNAYGTRFTDTRRIGLTLRYNFGIKAKEEKKEDFEEPETK